MEVQVEGAYANETIDPSAVPSKVDSKTIKIGIHSIPT